LAEENYLPPDLCYSASQIGSSGSDDRLLNFEWQPIYPNPSSQAPALGVHHTIDIKNYLGVSRYFKRIHHAKRFDDRENECNSDTICQGIPTNITMHEIKKILDSIFMLLVILVKYSTN